MWRPQKRQWWVIWIAVGLAILTIEFPVASVLILVVGVLVVWQLEAVSRGRVIRMRKPDRQRRKREIIFCGECGSPINARWKHCPECGSESWKTSTKR